MCCPLNLDRFTVNRASLFLQGGPVFSLPLRLDLRAVLHRRDAVQLVEGLEEAAVVRKAVFGAGGKDALAVGDVLAAALHPQLGQVVVDALLGVLLENAGQVLPADVGVLGQLGHGEVGVAVVLVDVTGDGGHQGVGGSGLAQPVLPDGLPDDQDQPHQQAAVHQILVVGVGDGGDCRCVLHHAADPPAVGDVGVEDHQLAGDLAALRQGPQHLQGLLPEGVVDLDDEPVVGVVIAGVDHAGRNQHQFAGVQLVLAAVDVVVGFAADHVDVFVVGVVVGHGLAHPAVGVPAHHHFVQGQAAACFLGGDVGVGVGGDVGTHKASLSEQEKVVYHRLQTLYHRNLGFSTDNLL